MDARRFRSGGGLAPHRTAYRATPYGPRSCVVRGTGRICHRGAM